MKELGLIKGGFQVDPMELDCIVCCFWENISISLSFIQLCTSIMFSRLESNFTLIKHIAEFDQMKLTMGLPMQQQTFTTVKTQ